MFNPYTILKMNTYAFYNGGTKSTAYEFDPNTTLDKVRNQLVSDQFIPAVDGEQSFRFVNYQNTDYEHETMIVGSSIEIYLPLKAIAGINDQIYLTDVNKVKDVDLIGFSTDWWFDRYMSCKMVLNTQDTEAKKSNSGKFQPFMLTNVKTANPNIAGISLDNVVICEQDSIVQFDISSWAAAGYGYQIKPVGSTPINSRPLYITFTDCPNGGRYARTGLRRYYAPGESQDGNTIKVVATDKLNIGDNTLNYMKFSLKTWKVTSFEKPAGKKHTCNLTLPLPKAFASKSTDEFSDVDIPYSKLVNADETVIPGGTIEPGTTTPSGDQSSQTIGTIYNVNDSQDSASVIGEVIFYVFVFKTREDADAVFGQMNNIDPSIWED